MHIAEGILPLSTLAGGAVVAAAGTAVGLRKLDDENIIQTAVLTSALFVASLIHVPVGPVPVHLVLNGLAGIILGWAIFPAYLTALLMQSLFFGYGGITTLGVNTVIMATPGLLCYYAFGRTLQEGSPRRAFAAGLLSGALAISVSCAMLCAVLMTAGREFFAVATAVFAAHLPVAAVEASVTASIASFLARVRPETFRAAPELKLDHVPE